MLKVYITMPLWRVSDCVEGLGEERRKEVKGKGEWGRKGKAAGC